MRVKRKAAKLKSGVDKSETTNNSLVGCPLRPESLRTSGNCRRSWLRELVDKVMKLDVELVLPIRPRLSSSQERKFSPLKPS